MLGFFLLLAHALLGMQVATHPLLAAFLLMHTCNPLHHPLTAWLLVGVFGVATVATDCLKTLPSLFHKSLAAWLPAGVGDRRVWLFVGHPCTQDEHEHQGHQKAYDHGTAKVCSWLCTHY